VLSNVKKVDDKINRIEVMKSSNGTLVLSLINIYLFFTSSMSRSIGMFVKSETTSRKITISSSEILLPDK